MWHRELTHIYLRKRSYKLQYIPDHSTSCPMSCYHHHINMFIPGIHSSPVHISYVGRQATLVDIVSWLYCIYPFIGHTPIFSSASAIARHYHSPSVVCCAILPVILISIQWWNPLELLVFPLSPLNSHSHIATTTARLPYTSYPVPTLFPLYSTQPSPMWLKLVGWLIILPTGVGWYIMGYESDLLRSCPYLRNFSYSVNLFTPVPFLFLRFIYRVLIPPAHHPARLRHPIRLHAHHINREAGHPLSYGCLPPLDVHSDGLIPAASVTASISEFYHSTPAPHLAVIPVICCAAWCGTPAGPWASPRSPTSYCCHIIALAVSPPFTLLPVPVPLLLSFPLPSLSCPTASELCTGLGITQSNICWCRWFSVPGIGTPLTMVGSQRSSVTRPYLPLSIVVRYYAWYAFSSPCLHFSNA